MIDTSGPVGTNGAALLRRTRNGLIDDVTTFGRPVPTMERREVAAIDPAGGTGAVATTPGRAASHEAPPSQLGHPGVPASAEIHGTGVAIAGPLAGALAMLMRERAAATLEDFIGVAQVPINMPADPGGRRRSVPVLETLTHGVTGDLSVRTYIATQAPLGGFTPGQSWQDLKTSLEAALPLDLDTLMDTATFDDDTLAAALDRVILKTRDGAAQAAKRDPGGDSARGRLRLPGNAGARRADRRHCAPGRSVLSMPSSRVWPQRPALTVLLCVPEKFLPGQPKKVEDVRRGGVGAALKALRDAAPGNVVLFTPTAGSGRPLHMASTTVIVDDAAW